MCKEYQTCSKYVHSVGHKANRCTAGSESTFHILQNITSDEDNEREDAAAEKTESK